ncbi:hypothetical protein GH714_011335 [Hevea brasiliensis]|uniref:Uncharacterized protein n=1 Tax=Hevea brasiliensis TaxID=3981 RepID=A0A6A6L0Q9_HEVBR|nr:hypothetical protein GH714_011335 [Hevea brasiliensis]
MGCDFMGFYDHRHHARWHTLLMLKPKSLGTEFRVLSANREEGRSGNRIEDCGMEITQTSTGTKDSQKRSIMSGSKTTLIFAISFKPISTPTL